MATKKHHYQELPGTKELYVLLNIINDKDKYSKILEEMEKTRMDANKAIEDLGIAGEITSYNAEAKVNYEKSKQVLREAQDKAEEILSEVNDKLVSTNKELDDREAAFKKLQDDNYKEIHEIQISVNKKENENREKEKELSLKESELARLSSNLKVLEQDLEEKRKILSDSIERTK